MNWPAPLAHLVRRYGDDAVERAGMKVLGYPASWCTNYREMHRILMEFK